jgi:rRNA maturation RNase YbeY
VSDRAVFPTVPADHLDAIVLVLRNRQKDRLLQVRTLRRVIFDLLQAMGLEAELGFHWVSAAEMARVNWRFLRHEGSTDVITFDYGSTAERLHGECFICVADAIAQADEFGTTWSEEVLRYVIHGILHLRGYDDLEPALRRTMKREENRWVRWVAARSYDLVVPPSRPVQPPRPIRSTGTSTRSTVRRRAQDR